MGRLNPERPDPSLLTGLAETAQRLGVKVNTVSVWQMRHADFPAPLVRLSCGPVFWYPDVEEWMERRRR